MKRLAPLTLLVLASSCTGSGSGSGGGPPAPPGAAAQLRTTATNQGVTAAPAAQVVSDDLFDLGQALFFDKILSGNMDVACSTCHLPSESGGDARTLPGGVNGMGLGLARTGGDIVPRQSPAILNVHLSETAFWDSRIEFIGGGALRVPGGATLTAPMLAAFTPGLEILAAQAMFPPTSRSEMRGQLTENTIADLADNNFAGIWSALTDRVTAIPGYQTLLANAYPGVLLGDINFAHLANAIAAFETRGFARIDSPFQRFLNGDDNALTGVQVSGGMEFFGPGACARCHDGPAFSDFLHHNIGMPQFGPGKGDGGGGADDFGREQVTGNANDRYRYRTPTLLNVELTAPYGRLGQYATLQDFVAHYGNATASLNAYSFAANVTDPGLAGTQLANEAAVLSNLSPLVSGPRNFNSASIVEFLKTLTADSALDLSDLVPGTVPSGLSIDG